MSKFTLPVDQEPKDALVFEEKRIFPLEDPTEGMVDGVGTYWQEQHGI
jgi:hypothetical protein